MKDDTNKDTQPAAEEVKNLPAVIPPQPAEVVTGEAQPIPGTGSIGVLEISLDCIVEEAPILEVDVALIIPEGKGKGNGQPGDGQGAGGEGTGNADSPSDGDGDEGEDSDEGGDDKDGKGKESQAHSDAEQVDVEEERTEWLRLTMRALFHPDVMEGEFPEACFADLSGAVRHCSRGSDWFLMDSGAIGLDEKQSIPAATVLTALNAAGFGPFLAKDASKIAGGLEASPHPDKGKEQPQQAGNPILSGEAEEVIVSDENAEVVIADADAPEDEELDDDLADDEEAPDYEKPGAVILDDSELGIVSIDDDEPTEQAKE